jgi:hypothetical protein
MAVVGDEPRPVDVLTPGSGRPLSDLRMALAGVSPFRAPPGGPDRAS